MPGLPELKYTPVSLGTQSNPGRYGSDGSARLYNLFAEHIGDEGKTPWPLYAVAGLREYANLAGAVGSGVRAFQDVQESGILLSVAGQLLYEITAGGGSVVVDTVGGITETGPVTMARNRNVNPHVAITVSGANYIWQGGSLTVLNDVDLAPANSVAGLDGYFIWGHDNGKMSSSAVDDTTVDALDFANAEANPDGLVRVAVRGRDLCAMGKKTIEFWRNTGEETFPFSRYEVADVGLMATTSVATTEQTLTFVAHDGTVRQLQGYQAVRISNHAVERDIADEPTQSAMDGVAWEAEGHSFYCLSGTNFSWVYDFTTGLWHNRKSYGLKRWKCSSYAKFDGKHIFGHYSMPKLFEASRHFYDEAGDPLVCEVIPPPINVWPYSMRLNAVRVAHIAGVGLPEPADSQNVDPQLMIETSKDGGVTFGSQRMKSVGKIGQRLTRVRSYRFGKFGEDGIVLKISISAACRRGLTGLAVAFDKLR